MGWRVLFVLPLISLCAAAAPPGDCGSADRNSDVLRRIDEPPQAPAFQ